MTEVTQLPTEKTESPVTAFPRSPRMSIWQQQHLPIAPEQGESLLEGFLHPADPRLTVGSDSSKLKVNRTRFYWKIW